MSGALGEKVRLMGDDIRGRVKALIAERGW
jgi:hypothetical protein